MLISRLTSVNHKADGCRSVGIISQVCAHPQTAVEQEEPAAATEAEGKGKE